MAAGPDRQEFSFFRAMYLSFFSRPLFADVGLNWKGCGLTYLLLLLTVCWVPVLIVADYAISYLAESIVPDMVQNMPDIVISNGEARVEAEMPFYLKEERSGMTVAIIDTTGSTTSLTNEDAIVLLTRDKLIFRNQSGPTPFSLGNAGNVTITPASIIEQMDFARKYMVPILFPLLLLSSFLYRLVLSVIYSGIAYFFASQYAIRLPFSALVRLSIVSMTPAIIIEILLFSTGYHSISSSGVVFLVMNFVYVSFAVQSTAIAMRTPGNTPV